MAGTVISLMQVLQDLTHPEHASASPGLALSSTLYGVLLANLLFLPLASKLEEFTRAEAAERSMIIEALRGLQPNEHPLRIAERLNAYELYRHIKDTQWHENACAAGRSHSAAVAMPMDTVETRK